MWFSFWPIDLVHDLLPPLLKVFEGTNLINQVLVWDKKLAPKVGGGRIFARRAEAIIYINVGDKPLASWRDKRKTRYLHGSIFEYAPDKMGKNSYWKPVALIKHLIELSTYPEKADRQVVLDMFAGAGSTGVAAVELGRDFRLIESHRGQYDLALANVLEALEMAQSR